MISLVWIGPRCFLGYEQSLFLNRSHAVTKLTKVASIGIYYLDVIKIQSHDLLKSCHVSWDKNFIF